MMYMYIITTLAGPIEKNPTIQVRPNSTVRLAAALRSFRELRPFAEILLAFICFIWIRTTVNTKMLHSRIRRMYATTVT